MARPDGRADDELRPITLRTRLHRDGRRLLPRVVRQDPRAVHRLDRRDVPRWMRATGQGLGDRRVLDAARCVARADRPRGRAGQAERTHRRDPAPHRPVAARGVRHEALGERQVDRRLRRAAGRRRHPHRQSSAAATSRCTTRSPRLQQRAISHAPAALVLRGDQRRHRRRHARARPALRRGQHRRGRHERGDARPIAGGEARFVEVQGTAEGVAFQPRRARRAAGARRGRPRADRRPAAATIATPPTGALPAEPPDDAARVRLGQPRQGGRDRRHPRGGSSSCCRAPPRSPTSWRTPARWRATPG